MAESLDEVPFPRSSTNQAQKTAVSFVALTALAFGLFGCSSEKTGPVREAVSHKDMYKQAYIYGFPLIAAYKAMYEFNINKSNSQYKGPFNTVISDSHTFTPKDTAIVSPNADTPYSMMQADLRAEPMVFCVPKIDKQRYYSVQLIDLYTFNYGYVGSRATGNDAGCYMVAGPEWKGETPKGIKKVFNSETQFSLLIYRTQLFNPADIANVKKDPDRLHRAAAFVLPQAAPTPCTAGD
jgi:hypothetical protein